MEGVLKSDIFFVVTTIAVVSVSICIIIISFYLVRILRDLKELSQKAKDEGERILDDVRKLREDMHNQGTRVGRFLALMASLLGVSKESRQKNKPKNETKT